MTYSPFFEYCRQNSGIYSQYGYGNPYFGNEWYANKDPMSDRNKVVLPYNTETDSYNSYKGGANDGKIDGKTKIANLWAGCWDTIKTPFSSVKNLALTVIGGVAFIKVDKEKFWKSFPVIEKYAKGLAKFGKFGKCAAVFVAVVGALIGLASGSYNAATAKTDAQAELAWKNIGASSTALGLSYFVRSQMKNKSGTGVRSQMKNKSGPPSDDKSSILKVLKKIVPFELPNNYMPVFTASALGSSTLNVMELSKETRLARYSKACNDYSITGFKSAELIELEKEFGPAENSVEFKRYDAFHPYANTREIPQYPIPENLQQIQNPGM